MGNLLTLLNIGVDVKLSAEQAKMLADLTEQQAAEIDALKAHVERLRAGQAAREAFIEGYCQGVASYCGRPLQLNEVFLDGARYHAEKEYPRDKDGE